MQVHVCGYPQFPCFDARVFPLPERFVSGGVVVFLRPPGILLGVFGVVRLQRRVFDVIPFSVDGRPFGVGRDLAADDVLKIPVVGCQNERARLLPIGYFRLYGQVCRDGFQMSW